MAKFLIRDGYSRSAVVPAVPGLHPELRARYRPALLVQRKEYLLPVPTPKDAAARDAALIERHVESWNVTDDGDQTAPVKKEIALLLQPALVQRLVDLILGYEPGQEEADAKN